MRELDRSTSGLEFVASNYTEDAVKEVIRKVTIDQNLVDGPVILECLVTGNKVTKHRSSNTERMMPCLSDKISQRLAIVLAFSAPAFPLVALEITPHSLGLS